MSLKTPVQDGHSSPEAVEIYVFESFRLDAGTKQLTRDGSPVELTPKAFDTLLLLVRQRSRVVLKEELIHSLWPNSFVTEDNLTQNIWTLRRALGDSTAHPMFIATSPRRGYRFLAPVSVEEGAADNAIDDLTSSVDANTERPSIQPALSSTPVRWHRAVWLFASACAVVAAWLGPRLVSSERVVAPRVVRFTQNAPLGTKVADTGVLSPDGHWLAFVTMDERSGQTQIRVRSLDSTSSHPLPSTEGASLPFWSPSSDALGFFSAGALKTVGLDGEPAKTVASTSLAPAGGSWGSRGIILFADRKSSVLSVSASGGTVRPVTTLDPVGGDLAHRWPQFLPDGYHFLFYLASSRKGRSGTYVATIDSRSAIRVLDEASSAAVYANNDYLLYVHDRKLVAQRFDRAILQTVGEPAVLSEDLWLDRPRVSDGARDRPVVSSAAGDVLAFGGGTRRQHLAWFGASGNPLGIVAAPVSLHDPTFLPGYAQFLAASNDQRRPGIWLLDARRGTASQFVADGNMPQSSPDGKQVAYAAVRALGAMNLYVKSIGAGTQDDLLLQTTSNKFVQDWSTDGRFVVFVTTSNATGDDLWLLPTFGDRRPIPFLETPSNEFQAQVSPDSRRIAYTSDESGAWEVYVQMFPSSGEKHMVSTGGGFEPRWRPDGTALYYLGLDGTLFSVEVTQGTSWQIAKPKPMFRAPIAGGVTSRRNRYLVADNGRRFLMDVVDEDEGWEPITVVLNWEALLPSRRR